MRGDCFSHVKLSRVNVWFAVRALVISLRLSPLTTFPVWFGFVVVQELLRMCQIMMKLTAQVQNLQSRVFLEHLSQCLDAKILDIVVYVQKRPQ